MPTEMTLQSSTLAPIQEPDAALPQLADAAGSAIEAWRPALSLPCRVTFGLPIPRFTLGDLLNLRVGTVLDTARPEGTDVVVLLNDHVIGWAEFESSGQQIAFRFTELAG